jgi:rare lipoprotein A
MKRMFISLSGCALLAAVCIISTPAAAYVESNRQWFDGAGRAEAARPVRSSRATRQRGRAVQARQGSDEAAPRASRRARAARTETSSLSSSLTGGSSIGGGIASYYWQPQRVASGGWFNPNAMTAAHRTLPFGTRVRVTNLGNGRSVTVTINDRGPFIRGRVIDLSRAAATAVGMTGAGLARVSMAVVGRG